MLVGKLHAELSLDTSPFMAGIKQATGEAKRLSSAMVHEIKFDASNLDQEVNRAGVLLTSLKSLLSEPMIATVKLDTSQFAQKANELYKFIQWMRAGTQGPPAVVRVKLDTAQFAQKANELYRFLNWINNLSKTSGFIIKIGLDMKQADEQSERLFKLLDALRKGTETGVQLKVTIDIEQFFEKFEQLRKAILWLREQVEKSYTIRPMMFTTGTEAVIQENAEDMAEQRARVAAERAARKASRAQKEYREATKKSVEATHQLGKQSIKSGKEMTDSLGKKPQGEIEKTTKVTERATWTIRGYIKDMSRVVTGILMSQLFYTILKTFKDVIKEAYNLRQEFEKMTISFEYLLGATSSQAKAMTSYMRDWAIATEFAIADFNDSFRQLLFAGVSLKDMDGVMHILSGTASVLGQDLNEVVSTMLQIQAATTVSTSELRRLARMGYPIGNILRKQLGLTAEDLKKINELDIPGDVMFKALVVGLEEYAQAGEDAAATTAALSSDIAETIKDITQLLATSGLDAWRNTLERILNVVVLLRKEILSVGVGGIMKLFPPHIREDILNIRVGLLALWDSLKRIGAVLRTYLGYSLRDFLTLLGRILPVVSALTRVFARLLEWILVNVPGIKLLVGALMGLGVVNIIIALFKLLTKVLINLIKVGVVKTATTLFQGLAKAFQISWKWGLALVGIIIALIALLMSNADKVKGWLKNITSGLFEEFDKFSDAGKISDQNQELEDLYSNWEDIKEAIASAAEELDPFISSFDEVYQIPKENEDIARDWDAFADALNIPEYNIPELTWDDITIDFWKLFPIDDLQTRWNEFTASLKSGKWLDDLWNIFKNSDFYQYWANFGGLLYDVITGDKSIGEAWNIMMDNFKKTEWYQYWSNVGGVLYTWLFGDRTISEVFEGAYNNFQKTGWYQYWSDTGGALYDFLYGDDGRGGLTEEADFVKMKLGHIWEDFKALGVWAWNGIKMIAVHVWNTISAIADQIWGFIKGAAIWAWNEIKETALEIWAEIKLIGENFWTDIKGFGIWAWNGIKLVGMTIWSGIRNAAILFWNGIRLKGQEIWGAIKEFAVGIWDSVVEAVVNWYNKGKDAVEQFVQGFKDFFKLPTVRIKIEYEDRNLGILGTSKVPRLKLQWGRTGGILDRATLIGAGEAGKEALVPMQGSDMMPFVNAIVDGLRGESNVRNNMPTVYVQYLIADDRGLRELERKMNVIRLEESMRSGLA